MAKFGLSTSGEKYGNDEAMRTMYMQYLDTKEQDIVYQTDIITGQNACIEKVLNIEETNDRNKTLNISYSSLESTVNQCVIETIPVSNVSVSQFITDLIITSREVNNISLNFDWTYCPEADQNIESEYYNHAQYANSAWLESYESTYNLYVSSGMIQHEALSRALQEASGMTSCRPNQLAGAVYWSTLMTTVGYGNAYVTSHVTRWLSYTFGFFSIFLFLAVVTQSATIIIAVVDDLIEELNLRRLTKGFTSCLCWLVILWSMIVLIGYLIFLLYANRSSLKRMKDDFPMSEYIWFSYISVTTVGFGDYSFPTIGTRLQSVIFFVFVIMCGNALVAAFTLKFYQYYLEQLSVKFEKTNDSIRKIRLFSSMRKIKGKKSFKCLTKMVQTYPRTFFLVRDMLIPSFIMIAICFLFGYFVANAECNGYYATQTWLSLVCLQVEKNMVMMKQCELCICNILTQRNKILFTKLISSRDKMHVLRRY